MKQKLPYILIALLTVSQVYSFCKISELENRIWNTNNALGTAQNTLNNQISNIYADVSAMLEEEASIIHDASIEIGAVDADTITVPVTFTVEPKQVTDSMTVSLQFENETIQLEKNGTVYTGIKQFALEAGDVSPTILIEDNGVQTVMEDNRICVYSIGSWVFPTLYPVYLSFGGDVYTRGEEAGEYKQVGDLFIEGDGHDEFESATIITYIDGKQVNEVSIDIALFADGNSQALPENTYSVTEGQVITSELVAVDSLGFTHQYPLEHYVARSEIQREPAYGDPSYDAPAYGEQEKITAPNGEVIYNTIIE